MPRTKLSFEKQSISPCIYVAKLDGKWFANLVKGSDDVSWRIEFYGYESIATTFHDAKAIVRLAAGQ